MEPGALKLALVPADLCIRGKCWEGSVSPADRLLLCLSRWGWAHTALRQLPPLPVWLPSRPWEPRPPK